MKDARPPMSFHMGGHAL